MPDETRETLEGLMRVHEADHPATPSTPAASAELLDRLRAFAADCEAAATRQVSLYNVELWGYRAAMLRTAIATITDLESEVAGLRRKELRP